MDKQKCRQEVTENNRRGKGRKKQRRKGRKKETVTDSKGEKPELVSCASTAEDMK